jgi:hypothetical protein
MYNISQPGFTGNIGIIELITSTMSWGIVATGKLYRPYHEQNVFEGPGTFL